MPKSTTITIHKHPKKDASTRKKMFYVSIPDEIRTQGEPKTKSFLTKREAVAYVAILERQYATSGIRQAGLTGAEKKDARVAMDILSGLDVSLLDAAKSYAEHMGEEDRSVTLDTLIESHIKAKEQSERSASHIAYLKYVREKVKPKLGDVLVCNLTDEGIAKVLHDFKLSGQSFNNILTVLFSVLKTGVRRKFLTENVVGYVDRVDYTAPAPRILTPAQAQALLIASEPYGLLPYFAIGVFAGIRRSGIERLKWKNIDFKEQEIDVPAEGKSSGYSTPMQDSLTEFITPYAKHSGFVVKFRGKLDRKLDFVREVADKWLIDHDFKKEATLSKDWPNNALRHTAASMLTVRYQDCAKVALWMHHDEAMLKKHYLKSVKPSVAKAFWSIRPQENPANVVPISQAG